MIRGVVAVTAAIVVAVVIALATGGRASSHGCIYATFPGAVGAGQISQCGAQARTTCATVYRPGAYVAASARTTSGSRNGPRSAGRGEHQ